MRFYFLPIFSVLFFCLSGIFASAEAATVTGGQKYTMPGWFKTSFLDIPEDIKEAAEQDKYLAVFFHLDECPYCAKMLDDNLTSGPNQQYAAQHFDFVGLNIKGNVEVTWVDGETTTLSGLAKKLSVFATPTIQVFDSKGKRVLNLQGYRGPAVFRQAMEYVVSKAYEGQSFKAYQDALATQQPVTYRPVKHALLSDSLQLAGARGPIAVLFEAPNCAYCSRFHEKTLNHPKVIAALKPYRFVRVMVNGSQPLTTPLGEAMTESQWATKLDISYTPSLLLYKEGKLLQRIETALYQQHLRESLEWVSGWKATGYPSLREFKENYRSQQIFNGENVDYAE